MKAVDFAVTQILPPDLHQDSYDLSKKGMASILGQVAARHPDKFRQISKELGDLGRMNAWRTGFSVRPNDTRPVIDVDGTLAKMDVELKALKRQKMNPDEYEDARNEIYMRYSTMIEKETTAAGSAAGNSFAAMVSSGARGNAAHTKAVLSTPALYTDAKGKLIPLFVRNSFSKGLRPAEWLAGTYGSRTAVTSTKRATAKGGDFLKLLTQNTLHFNVTEQDCGVNNGIDLDPNDPSIRGRVLAMPAGNLPAGSVLDKATVTKLREAGKPVVVRSAMTCRAKHGVCAKCMGVQPTGKFHKIGDGVGVTASAAIGEPIVQASLNVKHNSGMAKGKKSFSGFDYVSQFVQVPEEFKDKAAVAEGDGVVEKIEDAPQGGKYITVSGKQHLVLSGFEPTVKVGQKVEAGDILSEGLANPADIVRLRGLGEGRKYYVDRLGQMLAESGSPADRKHLELISRATLDNYRIDDPDEEDPWLPDDEVRENEFMRGYKKPKDTAPAPVQGAVNKYLQTPTLHYTVGTRITPKIAEHLSKNGVNEVEVSQETPKFSVEMPRLRVAAHTSKDWLANMGTSYLSKQLEESTARGDETNIQENYHYGPRLAFGVDAGKGEFGQNIETTGKF